MGFLYKIQFYREISSLYGIFVWVQIPIEK